MDDANTQISARPFHLLGVVAAFGPALAGGLFLSGYGSERAMRAAFGLRQFGGYDVAILMADGVIGAFFSAMLAICAFMFSVWASAKFSRWMYGRSFQRAHRARDGAVGRIVMAIGSKMNIHAIFVILLLEIILFSFVAMGSVLGTIRAHQIRNDLVGDCGRCFSYKISDRSITGIGIAADDTRIAIAVGVGRVEFINWSDIQQIGPVPIPKISNKPKMPKSQVHKVEQVRLSP